MNRTLKLSMLLALTLGSTQAMALGLGQIRVKSALGQPLVADIPLVTDYPGEAKHVQVGMADAKDFSRAGLDLSRFPADLSFKVITGTDGHRFIRVTSAHPVRATFLDFLVQVQWPRGRLLREFTVLLDPPHMAAGTPQRSSPRRGATHATQAGVARGRSAGGGQAGAGRIANGRYGPVHNGENLTEIARKTLPGGVSVNQMLVALYQANRGAFVHDNMNGLKRGAVLRIPTRQQAQSVGAAKALAEVRRQYQDWKGRAAQSPAMVSSTGGGGHAASGSAGAGSGGDQLKLVPPKHGGGVSGHPGVHGGTGSTQIEGLRQDLARAKESLSNLQQESSDLKSRVSDLKSINAKNQRLLSLKNAEIAELQKKLADARKAAGMPAAKPVASGTPAAPASTAHAAAPAAVPAAAGSSARAAAPATAGSAASASTPTAKPASKPKPKPVAKPAPRRAVHHAAAGEPWYMQTWAWIAGGAVAIALLLLALVKARSGRKPAEPPRSSLADQFGDSPLPPEGEGGDDLDQDQAELLDELAENPDDIGLHLELVSLYYGRRDVDHFEAAAEAMYAHVSDPEQPEWQEVRAMGEDLVPEHPLFARDDKPAAPAPAGDPTDVPGFDDPEAFDVDSFISGGEDFGGHADEQPADDDATVLRTPDHGEEEADGDAAAAGDDEGSRSASRGYSFDFDLTPRRPAASAPDAPTEDEYDALPPLPDDGHDDVKVADGGDQHVDDGAHAAITDLDGAPADDEAPLPDDPVDTKLDLARAYLDMGDPSGARAMLEEVLAEGSQAQKDTAQKLLDEIG